MDKFDELSKAIIKARKKEKESYDSTAVVSKIEEGKIYVRINGSTIDTPCSSTVACQVDDVVRVRVSNHRCWIIGNVSNPAINTYKLEETKREIVRYVDVNSDLDRIQVKELIAIDVKALNAEIENIKAGNIDAIKVVTKALEADNAIIKELIASSIDAEYANIDFSNIGMSAIEHLFTESGIIKDLVVDDTKITGELVGVTIKGDLIVGNTIVADKLVVKGEDGLYYKLNTDGVTTEAEQTEYNSLNGSVITAKSITATKISVEDLVAFGATIGGFHITYNSIYSGVKESAVNDTRGIYIGNDGQFSFGDNKNFIAFRKDENGIWKLYTSFMDLDSNGLVLGDMSSDTLGKNLFIKNSGVAIRDGTRELAEFGRDSVSLAYGRFLLSNRDMIIPEINGNVVVFREANVNNIYGYERMVLSSSQNGSLDSNPNYSGRAIVDLQTYPIGSSITLSTFSQNSVTDDVNTDTNAFIRIETQYTNGAGDESSIKMDADSIDLHTRYGLSVDGNEGIVKVCSKDSGITCQLYSTSSGNRGLYDHTLSAWDIYRDSEGFLRIPSALYLGAGAFRESNAPVSGNATANTWPTLVGLVDNTEAHNFISGVKAHHNTNGERTVYLDVISKDGRSCSFSIGWDKDGNPYTSCNASKSAFSGGVSAGGRFASTNGSMALIHTANGHEFQFGIDTNGTRGIWDKNLGRWITCIDTDGYTRLQGQKVYLYNNNWKYIFFDQDSNGNYFRPQASSIYLGSGSYRWITIYASNSLNTSDLKLKDVITNHDWKVDEFIRGLKPIAYRSIEEGADGNRIHMGFGAQDVSKLCKDIGIGDMSLYEACYSDEEQGRYHGEDVDDSELTWGLKYNEFIAPMVLEMQSLMDRCDELERKNSELEARLERLERMIG